MKNSYFRFVVTLTFASTISSMAFAQCPLFENAQGILPAAQDGLAAIATGDLNADGRADIVTNKSVLINPGNGPFRSENLPFPSQMTRVALADLDNDGDIDVAGVGGNTVAVLLNDGSAHFSQYSSRQLGRLAIFNDIKISDLNNDGTKELLLSSAMVNKLVGFNWRNTSTQNNLFLPGSPIGLGLADLNGDGRDDIAIAAESLDGTALSAGLITVKNKRPLEISTVALATATLVHDIDLADFNGDGQMDAAIAVEDSNQDAALLLGGGDGTFVPGTTIDYPDLREVNTLLAADLDGNGTSDLAIGGGSGTPLVTLTGGGNGDFDICQRLGDHETVTDIASADFNGDGKLDLAVLRYLVTAPTDAVAILFNVTP